MLGLDYLERYWDDAKAMAAFNDFLIEIHGLDLTLWNSRVGWDVDFVHFSFFDGDRIVSSTSVYCLDMRLHGEWHRAAQISSVGTHPDWRRKGLNAELTRRALDWIRMHGHRGTFLFSDDDAVPFYAKQGFVEQSEWKYRLETTGRSVTGARVLNYDADEALLRHLVESRCPVSEQLGVRSPKLELFHLLYENAGELRYLPAFDLVAACEQSEGVLSVYDLIGPELAAWSELEPYLIDEDTRTIEFSFCPDRLDIPDAKPVEDRSSRLHVIPGEDLFTGQVMVPPTAYA